MFKELHPNIRTRIYLSFLSKVVSSMIFPFMAIYFTEKINAETASILLIINIAVQFLANLYGGYLADLIGRKKIMVLGELIKVFAFTGMLISNSPYWTSPWLTFMMMLLVGISSGLTNPASDAMLIDVSTPKTRTYMYSINYWAVNLSIMIGSIIGGWFFRTHLFELILAMLAMSILTAWLTIYYITETWKKKDVPQKQYGLKPLLNSYRIVISDLPFLLFTLAGIAIMTIEFQRNNFISVRLAAEFQQIQIDFLSIFSFSIDGIKVLSLLTLENTLIIVLFTSFTSKWVQTKSMQKMMYVGFILFTVGYSIFTLSNHFSFLIFGVFILSIGELIYVPCRQSILADIVDEKHRASYMAINGLVFQAGKLIGAASLFLGQATGAIGIAGLLLFSCLSGIILSEIALRKKVKSLNNLLEIQQGT